MTCSHSCRLPTPIHTPQKVKFACLLIYPRRAGSLQKSPPELLAFLSCPAASEDQSIIRPPPLPANTHTHTHTHIHTHTHTLLPALLQLSDITGYLAVLSGNPFFFLVGPRLLSLLLTVIHFINSCLHATLQHCF